MLGLGVREGVREGLRQRQRQRNKLESGSAGELKGTECKPEKWIPASPTPFGELGVYKPLVLGDILQLLAELKSES